MIDLDGLEMFVSSTATNGVVDRSTRLRFLQRGDKVAARYSGGNVERGWLIGRSSGATIEFRYVQREAGGGLHHGRSVCDVSRTPAGRVRIVEHFRWTSREGSGTNCFDEIGS